MKNKLSKILLTSLIAISLGACGGETSSQNNSGPETTSSVATSNTETTSSTNVESSLITSTEASPIKSLTAKKDIVSIKIDESALLSNYYELKGFKSLSATQKKVTITSSDPSIVEINAKYTSMTAKSIGTSTITVVSNVDNSKTCTFTVTVEDCYFDRKLTSVNSKWDTDHEMDEENPYIRVNTQMDQGIYVRNSDGLKWYIETEITIHKVNAGEEWPKFGIVANTTDNIKEKDNVQNKFYYYFDANLNQENEWVNFGVCEVKNIGNWAWNDGIMNNEARCNYVVHKSNGAIGYNQKFKIGMIRDGFNCHLFYDGSYMCSIKVLGHIFGEYNDETKGYTDPVNCVAGFFSFNSDVTFSNYNFINDADIVDAMIPATPSFNENWEKD